jgi:hypothetical protein
MPICTSVTTAIAIIEKLELQVNYRTKTWLFELGPFTPSQGSCRTDIMMTGARGPRPTLVHYWYFECKELYERRSTAPSLRQLFWTAHSKSPRSDQPRCFYSTHITRVLRLQSTAYRLTVQHLSANQTPEWARADNAVSMQLLIYARRRTADALSGSANDRLDLIHAVYTDSMNATRHHACRNVSVCHSPCPVRFTSRSTLFQIADAVDRETKFPVYSYYT